ncbi:MAG: alpha/beta fold hydrolase [Nitratireductor sp.]|nr:alpha/beta fold hydrolase [Nitratireductor sp.]
MSRETLLLLPGHMCDARLFAPQVDRFADRYRVVVADLAAGHTFDDHVRNAIDAAGEGAFNLAGLSMGGMIAIQMATEMPQRILRLALLSTTGEAEKPHRTETRDRWIARARAEGMEPVAREELAPTYLSAASADRADMIETVVAMAVEQGLDVFARQSRALTLRRDCRAGLARFTGPALVLSGDRDKLFSVEKHRDLAGRLSGGEQVTLAGAGHLPTLEMPERVNEAFEIWLARPVQA